MPDSPLPVLYQQMADMTQPLCGTNAGGCASHRGVNRCCHHRYCEAAKMHASRFYGITLEAGDGELPFMGPHGCTVPPHLRPVCTLHICSFSYASPSTFARDEQKTVEYVRLRKQILIEAEREGRTPVWQC